MLIRKTFVSPSTSNLNAIVRISTAKQRTRMRILPNSRSLSFSSSSYLQSQSQSQSQAEAQQIRMILLGSPGSGKGTLSNRLLSEFPSLNNLSAGDALRHHISKGTEIGKEADKVIKRGELMPDQVMMKLCYVEIEKLAEKDWLLDGFPRTVGQAKLLDSALESSKKPLGLVVYLDVPEEVILQRILERYIHPPSGRVYNLSFNPPKTPGKDDVTGEPLEQRPDDNPETFRKRLVSFRRETEPIKKYYEDLTKSKTDGNAKGTGSELECVTLRGTSSDEIWPRLLREVKDRFGR